MTVPQIFAPDLGKLKGPRPSGHVPACVYGCCWKLPGQTWAEAQKRGDAKKGGGPKKGPPPMPPRSQSIG